MKDSFRGAVPEGFDHGYYVSFNDTYVNAIVSLGDTAVNGPTARACCS
jgi:hypothetical protein